MVGQFTGDEISVGQLTHITDAMHQHNLLEAVVGVRVLDNT